MSAPTTQKTVITLNGPSDWDDWLAVIKTIAIGAEIWDSIDPSKPKTELKEPNCPTSATIDPNKTTIASLSDAEKEQLELLRFDYRRKITLYDRKTAALASLRMTIQEMISHSLLPYTFECEYIYDILVTLMNHIALTDRARQLEAST